jgi:hypothetical protein
MEPYITGQWVHVTAVRDKKNSRLKLYANGVRLPPSNPGNPNNDGTDVTGDISNPVGLYIGDASREDAPFQGEMDDLRFFRAALTDEQVAALAAKAPIVEKRIIQTQVMKRVVPARPSEIPPMSAHFPLNEGRGSVLTDVVGGAVGQLTNADDASWSSSSKGIALQLDGIDQRVIVPNSPGFDFADESFSVSFHVRWKRGENLHHQHLICKGDYSTEVSGETGIRWEANIRERGFSFIVDDNVNKSTIQVSGEPILKSDWVHVVAVRDRRDKRLKLYFNGDLQASNDPENEAYNGTDRTGGISNPRELVIGDSSRRDNPVAGEMADVRIFRTALTEAQVAGVAKLRRSASANPLHVSKSHASVPPMSAHFPLDESEGNVVTEVINGVKGELVNADPSTSWIPGKIGGALHLDGVNDRVFVPHHPGFDFAGESFSVSFMMRWPKGQNVFSERFLTKGDYDASQPGQTGKRWEIYISDHENMTFVIDDGVGDSSRLKVPLAPYITGEWVHVVAVRDTESKVLRLYADGVLLKSIEPDNPRSNGIDVSGDISNPQRLTIGDAFVLDAPFGGDLDDIRIFRTALTQKQISAIGSLAK